MAVDKVRDACTKLHLPLPWRPVRPHLLHPLKPALIGPRASKTVELAWISAASGTMLEVTATFCFCVGIPRGGEWLVERGWVEFDHPPSTAYLLVQQILENVY